jgi:glyceraldehyde-3-phosphate dehydrogenase/erythrose-4-phosphate dehydrogenase
LGEGNCTARRIYFFAGAATSSATSFLKSSRKLVVGGKAVQVLKEREPAKLPWKQLGVDIVVESTGFFTEREGPTSAN